MGSIFEPLISSGKVDQLADKPQIAGLKASLDLPAKDYLKAMRIRRLIQNEVSKLFSQYDALLAPGRANGATKIDQRLDAAPPGMPPAPADPGFRGIIQMGNLAGLPALVLPCGFAGNLPLAIQLVGVPFSENRLLADRPRIPIENRLAQAPPARGVRMRPGRGPRSTGARTQPGTIPPPCRERIRISRDVVQAANRFAKIDRGWHVVILEQPAPDNLRASRSTTATTRSYELPRLRATGRLAAQLRAFLRTSAHRVHSARPFALPTERSHISRCGAPRAHAPLSETEGFSH